MMLRDKLIALSVMKKGNWNEIYEVLKNDERLQGLNETKTKEMLKQVDHFSVLTILDEEYPECFKEIASPPFVLYYQGDLGLLRKSKMSLVGSRRPSEEGIKSTLSLMEYFLKREIAIVGNLQLGIEAIAQWAAIKKGKTITILSSGFSTIYPPENYDLYRRMIKDHLVLTEYPPKVFPSAARFYRAQYLLQELSDVSLIVEMTKNEARLDLIKKLIDEGKIIYALPASYQAAHSSGCLELIRYGAHCFTNAKEVLKWVE